MKTKQTQEQLAQIIQALGPSLKPAVLLDCDANSPPEIQRKVRANSSYILAYMEKHFADADGIIDASLKNWVEAALALQDQLSWEIPPKKKNQRDYLQSNDGARQNQPKDSELDIAMAHEKKRRQALGDAANAETMAEAAAIVRNHSSISHSRTARERAVLREEFNRLVVARVHPKDVLAGVKAKQDSFANGDITRPTFGGR